MYKNGPIFTYMIKIKMYTDHPEDGDVALKL